LDSEAALSSYEADDTLVELLTILNTPTGAGSRADASLILADQVIAAKLSIANGSNPTAIISTIADANSLLSGFRGSCRTM